MVFLDQCFGRLLDLSKCGHIRRQVVNHEVVFAECQLIAAAGVQRGLILGRGGPGLFHREVARLRQILHVQCAPEVGELPSAAVFIDVEIFF